MKSKNMLLHQQSGQQRDPIEPILFAESNAESNAESETEYVARPYKRINRAYTAEADLARLGCALIAFILSTATLVAKLLDLPQWLYVWGSIGMATNTAFALSLLAVAEILSLFAKYEYHKEGR